VPVYVVDQHRSRHPTYPAYLAYLVLRSSSAAAKNAEAIRKISLARRKFLVLAFEVGDALRLRGRDVGAVTLVDLGLGDPRAQRLGMDAQLLTDSLDSADLRDRVTPQIDRQPDCALPKLVRVLPRCRHDSHPSVE
jgi:hypothetical protein